MLKIRLSHASQRRGRGTEYEFDIITINTRSPVHYGEGFACRSGEAHDIWGISFIGLR
jgi:hypothetical protein